MAYLGKYIRQILSRKEAVVLPGFGSLVLEEGKGIQREDGRIDPPGAVIRFDATKPNDDGKLADEYAAGEQMDPEEARQQVLELVDAIRFKLDKGETYKLDLVGEFSRDDDNRILFTRDPNWVIDPELFGLSSLDLLELENEEEQKAEETQEEQEAAAAAARDERNRIASMHQTAPMKARQQGKAQRKRVNKWRIIWIVAVSLIAVLTLILLIPSDNGLEIGKDGIIIRDTEIGNGDGEGPVQGTGQQQDGRTVVQDDLDAAANESLQEQEKMDDGPVQPPVQGNRYFIITGSFRNLGNATEMMEKLKTAGYPAEIILTENRLYRVSVKSFATKQEALNALPALKSGEGLDNAWLLTR